MILNYCKQFLIVLFFLSYSVQAHTGLFSKEKVERKIHKEFTVKTDATLEVDNSFGDVNIVTWDKNQIQIDVTIRVRGRNQKKIDERLESISIQFQNNPERVSAQTQIEELWQWSWFQISYQQTDFEIDYEIKMPHTNNLEISNDYGSIFLDEIDGNTAINCDYGKVILGELRGLENTLTFDYTANSSIDFIKKGTIRADYSGFELGRAEQITLAADYTSSKIERVEILEFNTDYGKLSVSEGGIISGKGDYITLRFGNIQRELDIETDYGSIRVAQILPSAQRIIVDSEYTTVRLGVHPKWDFNFDVDLDYAGFQTELPLYYQKEIREDTEKLYQGYHHNASSENILKVTAEYGNLKIINPTY